MLKILENLAALGLLFDVIGVFILGIPMVFNAKKDIFEESCTYYSFNQAQVNSLSKSRIDIPVGSIMLFIGFIFQFLATVRVSLPEWITIVGWIIAIIFPAYYCCRLRSQMVNHFVSAVEDMHKESK